MLVDHRDRVLTLALVDPGSHFPGPHNRRYTHRPYWDDHGGTLQATGEAESVRAIVAPSQTLLNAWVRALTAMAE